MGSEKNPATVEYWEERYNQKSTSWFIEQAHPILVRQIRALTGGDGQSKRIFVPLCGKTRDIPYLLSQGHQVFGIEGVLQPILELAAENSLKLKYNPEESIYHTEDGRLEIYHGDMLKCPIEKYGPFDCVWDRASFVAFPYSSRQAYVDVMKRSLLNSDKSYHKFKYLLQAVEYDKNLYPGPPHSVHPDDVAEFYGQWANFKLVETLRIDEDSCWKKSPQDIHSDRVEVAYMISPRKT